MNLHIYTSEDQLIEGCKKNEPTAQKMLFDQYAAQMLGICRRYINNTHDAECIMIEGFTKTFEAISKFRNEGSFEGWLKRIMINCCLGYLRKNKSLSLQVEISEAGALYDETIGDALEKEDLLKMIDRLPTGYRTVFNLFAIEGYSHMEIAEELNITVSTSKSQLNRARNLLQRFIQETVVNKRITTVKQ